MRIILWLATLAVTLASANSAYALSRINGTRLLHDCQAAVLSTDTHSRLTVDEDRRSYSCIGYVQGVLDTNEFWKTVDARDHNSMKHYCINRGTSLEQIIRILVNYLEANPKELSETGWICIQGALLKEFSC